jgi:hypothetical protein
MIVCDARDVGVYDECVCCGGSATLGGTQEALTVNGRRYCSEDCAADWEAFLRHQDKVRAEDWCPTCGYDQREHASDCADWLGHLRERVEEPHLYAAEGSSAAVTPGT